MQMSAQAGQEITVKKFVTVKKIDSDQQIIYGEVYAPYTLDTYEDMMLPDDIELMAHRYLTRKDLDQTIDVNHDNLPVAATPVESFIARKGDPDYTEGAWVLGVKIFDEAVWSKIKKGDLGGFSMEAVAKMYPAVVEVDLVGSTMGVTEDAEGHKHYFFVEMDSEGVVVGGRTSKDAGHVHEIRRGTTTDQSWGHSHRFSLD